MENINLKGLPYTITESGSDLWDENGRWIPPDDPRYIEYLKAWIDSWGDPVDVVHQSARQKDISDEEPF